MTGRPDHERGAWERGVLEEFLKAVPAQGEAVDYIGALATAMIQTRRKANPDLLGRTGECCCGHSLGLHAAEQPRDSLACVIRGCGCGAYQTPGRCPGVDGHAARPPAMPDPAPDPVVPTTEGF